MDISSNLPLSSRQLLMDKTAGKHLLFRSSRRSRWLSRPVSSRQLLSSSLYLVIRLSNWLSFSSSNNSSKSSIWIRPVVNVFDLKRSYGSLAGLAHDLESKCGKEYFLERECLKMFRIRAFWSESFYLGAKIPSQKFLFSGMDLLHTLITVEGAKPCGVCRSMAENFWVRFCSQIRTFIPNSSYSKHFHKFLF